MPAADAGGDAGGGEEDSALLAVPPGSRNSPRLTPGAKGKKYYPVKQDKRQSGARSRSYASKHSKEKSSTTLRNIVPGAEINSLASVGGISAGIYENEQSIYSLREEIEEERLFDIHESLRTLLGGLENKEKLLVENKDEDKTQQKA